MISKEERSIPRIVNSRLTGNQSKYITDRKTFENLNIQYVKSLFFKSVSLGFICITVKK